MWYAFSMYSWNFEESMEPEASVEVLEGCATMIEVLEVLEPLV